MRRADEEGEGWDELEDDALEEMSPFLDTRKRSLFRRISRQRATYFADIRPGEGGEDDQESVSCDRGAGGSMSKIGVPGGSQNPASQNAPGSSFADVSTWCCDAFVAARVSAHFHQPVWDERQLIAISEQPTLILPVLASGFTHIADQPTEPLLVIISRGGGRGKKRSGILSRLCPGFLPPWFHRHNRGPRARKEPVLETEQRTKKAVVKSNKQQAVSGKVQKPDDVTGKGEKQAPAGHKHQPQTVPGSEKKQTQRSKKEGEPTLSAGEQEKLVEKAHLLEKAKLDAKAEQETLVRSQEKRGRSKKGSQLLLERLREREQRGDISRTLTPPILRPARVPRPPTDSLFGK